MPAGKRFLSKFTHTLDAKGRVAVPQKYRAYLSTDDGTANGFVSAWTENCLALWPAETWDAVMDGIEGTDYETASQRELARTIFSSAAEIAFDGQGRYTIPPDLRRAAGLSLESTVMVVGAGDHAEIWDQSRWDEYMGNGRPLETLLEGMPRRPRPMGPRAVN